MSTQGTIIIIAESPTELRELIKSAVLEALPSALVPSSCPSSDTLLTKEEACAELGVSKTTLTVWMQNAVIPYIRLGRRIYFERAKLIEAGRTHTKFQRYK